jgi:plasmid stability protein
MKEGFAIAPGAIVGTPARLNLRLRRLSDWIYTGSILEAAVPVTLSIKTVPDDLAEALRERTRRNHRSIQGELMTILESAVGAKPFRARALFDRVRALGFETPDEAVEIVREGRDAR